MPNRHHPRRLPPPALLPRPRARLLVPARAAREAEDGRSVRLGAASELHGLRPAASREHLLPVPHRRRAGVLDPHGLAVRGCVRELGIVGSVCGSPGAEHEAESDVGGGDVEGGVWEGVGGLACEDEEVYTWRFLRVPVWSDGKMCELRYIMD